MQLILNYYHTECKGKEKKKHFTNILCIFELYAGSGGSKAAEWMAGAGAGLEGADWQHATIFFLMGLNCHDLSDMEIEALIYGL